MDQDGQASAGGNNDRLRSTVTGPLPQLDDLRNEVTMRTPSENMKLPWSASPSGPASPAAPSTSPGSGKQASHKRSLSGSLLAKLSFLKGVVEDGLPPSRDKEPPSPRSQKSPKSIKGRKSVDDDDALDLPVSPVKGESAMSSALNATKTRKRKGSLRKTALLGTRRLVTETRERRSSIMQRSPSTKQSLSSQSTLPISPTKRDFAQASLPQDSDSSNGVLMSGFSYENVEAMSSSDSGWNESAAATSARLSLLTDHRAQQEQQRKASTELTSPQDLKSPVSNTSYTSTTDDDDILTFDRPANSFVASQSLKKPLSATATSYFPSLSSVSDTSLDRRLSSKQRPSPLSHNITTLSSYTEPEPHDYTETEYWGWVILFVTWLTFAVGMGSCLEIWSWAWDVGETPYAPPELEDDPTLPIVGYYPALIVLTGVVAWAWITVAWVGMKYFRHAKIEV